MTSDIDDNFDDLRDVLHSSLPDSTKLFFARLIVNSGFRAHFGFSDPAWENRAECRRAIVVLEQAGFLVVVRDGNHIRYVARRDCGKDCGFDSTRKRQGCARVFRTAPTGTFRRQGLDTASCDVNGFVSILWATGLRQRHKSPIFDLSRNLGVFLVSRAAF